MTNHIHLCSTSYILVLAHTFLYSVQMVNHIRSDDRRRVALLLLSKGTSPLTSAPALTASTLSNGMVAVRGIPFYFRGSNSSPFPSGRLVHPCLFICLAPCAHAASNWRSLARQSAGAAILGILLMYIQQIHIHIHTYL